MSSDWSETNPAHDSCITNDTSFLICWNILYRILSVR